MIELDKHNSGHGSKKKKGVGGEKKEEEREKKNGEEEKKKKEEKKEEEEEQVEKEAEQLRQLCYNNLAACHFQVSKKKLVLKTVLVVPCPLVRNELGAA